MRSPVWEMNHISSQFPDFSFHIQNAAGYPGETVALIGPNGAGKTTFIKILMGLHKPDNGKIKIFSNEINSLNMNDKKKIGYLSDEPGLFYELSGSKNLKIISSFFHDWDYPLQNHLTDITALPLHKKVDSLSRGNKVLLSLIAALCRNPLLLIMDEPTTNLDIINKKKIIHILNQIKENKSAHLLFSSHQTDDIEEIADRIFFIHNGSIVLEFMNHDIYKTQKKSPVIQNMEKIWEDKNSVYLSINKNITVNSHEYEKINLREFTYAFFSNI